MPRATVVVPTHNRPALLGRALDSLAAQSYQDFEVVVVNDGGLHVDEVLAVDRGLHLRLIEHEVNRGRSAARNTGIAAAEGELLAVLDDDDRFYPHHLETTVGALSKFGPGHAVYTHAVQVVESEDGAVIERKVTGAQEFSHDLLLVTNYICAICALVPTEVLLDLHGFDTSLDVLEDWELWLRVAGRLTWHHVEVPTAEYRIRQGRRNSTTREFFRFHTALERVYEKHPVPRGSVLQSYRDQMSAGSRGRASAYGFDSSVVVACSKGTAGVLETLANVVSTMGNASYEVVLLAPTTDGWGTLMDGLKGDVQLYAVGDVGPDLAWEWARQRAGGRDLLLLEAGEVIDRGLLEMSSRQTAPAFARVGRLPLAS
jgi:glycosyltransferase involved in cell wall biosynthesis